MNVYLQVERALTPVERDLFLLGVTSLNPRLDGAQVADVLEMLDNADENLQVVERMHLMYRDRVKARRVLTSATHVVWFWNKALPAVPFNDKQVLALCARVESGEIAAGRDS